MPWASGSPTAPASANAHGSPPERHRVPEVRRALAWGFVLPIVILAGALIAPWAWLGLAAYPAQIMRLALRADASQRFSWVRAYFLTLGKFPETLGIFEFWLGRVTRRRRVLIEYK